MPRDLGAAGLLETEAVLVLEPDRRVLGLFVNVVQVDLALAPALALTAAVAVVLALFLAVVALAAARAALVEQELNASSMSAGSSLKMRSTSPTSYLRDATALPFVAVSHGYVVPPRRNQHHNKRRLANHVTQSIDTRRDLVILVSRSSRAVAVACALAATQAAGADAHSRLVLHTLFSCCTSDAAAPA